MYSYLKKHLELDQKITGKSWFLLAFKENRSSRKIFSSSPVRKSMERFRLLIRQNNLPDGIIIFIKEVLSFYRQTRVINKKFFSGPLSTLSINENSTLCPAMGYYRAGWQDVLIVSHPPCAPRVCKGCLDFVGPRAMMTNYLF